MFASLANSYFSCWRIRFCGVASHKWHGADYQWLVYFYIRVVSCFSMGNAPILLGCIAPFFEVQSHSCRVFFVHFGWFTCGPITSHEKLARVKVQSLTLMLCSHIWLPFLFPLIFLIVAAELEYSLLNMSGVFLLKQIYGPQPLHSPRLIIVSSRDKTCV